MIELIKILSPVALLALLPKFIDLIGDDEQFEKLKKANRRLKAFLKPIVNNEAFSRLFLQLNIILSVLGLILSGLYFIITYNKYHNLLISISIASLIAAASINILYRSYRLDKALKR